MTGPEPDDEMNTSPEWPDPVLREKVARALSDHSDPGRGDYAYFRGYWLGAADAMLEASGLADVIGERDRARDVAVALEQECLGLENPYGLPARRRAFAESGGLDRILGQEAEQQDNDAAAHAADPFTVHLIGPVDPGDGNVYARCCGRQVYERAQHVTYEPGEVTCPGSDGPDARRPAVVAGEWVRILERPAGHLPGQIGKVLPPGFTPPSTPASRVIAVETTAGEVLDATAWERGSWLDPNG